MTARPDVQIVYPVHSNPNVAGPVRRLLTSTPAIELLEPVGYVEFVDLMTRSYLILTDSGGIQEEAPSLGKPVLVMRDNTERPEAVEAGTAALSAQTPARLFDEPQQYQRMSEQRNPYGDGQACRRIAEALERYSPQPVGRRAIASPGRGGRK